MSGKLYVLQAKLSSVYQTKAELHSAINATTKRKPVNNKF